MPKLQEVISRIDEDKLNSYDEPKKTLWINAVNKLIHTDIHKSTEAYTDITYPDSQDTELLVSTPYDSLYDYYVYAMIDFLNMEFQSYNNYMEMYNSTYNEYAKHYLRNNMPAQKIITNARWY